MGKKLHARTRPPAQHATKRPASVATSDDDDEEKQERERDGRARAINNGTARRPESLAVLPRPRDQRRWSKSAGGRGRERTVVWRRCAALGPGRAVLVLSSPPRPGGRYIGGVWLVAVPRPRHRIHAA